MIYPYANLLLVYKISGGEKRQVTKPSKLLDGLSEFVLTYEDKEGDWMLVGDVPWGYATSIKNKITLLSRRDERSRWWGG